MEQIAPFEPQFHFNRMVSAVEKQDDGSFIVTTDEDERIKAKVVVIAAGGGSFQPKRPPVPGIDAFEDTSVFYSVRRMEEFRDHDILIVGGGDSALDWTLSLQPIAKSLTLLHRRDAFRAAPDSVNKMKALVDQGKVKLQLGQVTGLNGADGVVTSANVKTSEGDAIELSCTRILPFFGLTMKLGPICRLGIEPQ